MRKPLDIPYIIQFIQEQPPGTNVYLGADSERYKKNDKWYADYTLAVVVHKGGRNGCKVFGEVHTELDFDQKNSRPVMRLMNEVYKISELYLKLGPALMDRHVEIHLDLNEDEAHASNLVAQQAIGYIRGVCEMTPHLKPNAPAASFAADRLKEILHTNYV